MLPSATAEAEHRAMKPCWIDASHDSFSFVTHNAGSQFIKRVSQERAELLDIETKLVPFSLSNFMGFVERYHVPTVKWIYKCFKN